MTCYNDYNDHGTIQHEPKRPLNIQSPMAPESWISYCTKWPWENVGNMKYEMRFFSGSHYAILATFGQNYLSKQKLWWRLRSHEIRWSSGWFQNPWFQPCSAGENIHPSCSWSQTLEIILIFPRSGIKWGYLGVLAPVHRVGLKLSFHLRRKRYLSPKKIVKT